MVEEWVAFCSTKKFDNKRVTMDTLDHLEREVTLAYVIYLVWYINKHPVEL